MPQAKKPVAKKPAAKKVSSSRKFSPSEACTQFVAKLKYSDIPKEVIDTIKRDFLDWLGCAIAGAKNPFAVHARKFVNAQAGKPEASIFGEAKMNTMCLSAMANAYYSHIEEMDDVDRTSISHPATPTMAAAMAIAPAKKKNGKDLLCAVIAGFEVMLRIGTAITPAHYKVFHTTATTGVFGAAMTAGYLLGLSEEQLGWALGSAGTMSAGLWQFLPDGAMSKFLHTGMAASNGVLAATMASTGFTGARHILEGEQGFFEGFARQKIDEKIFKDFGKYYRAGTISFKPYPCCRHTQSSIDAGNELRLKLKGEELKHVLVGTYKTAMNIAGHPNPTNTREAKFSVRYTTASSILRGLAEESHFSEKSIKDPKLQALLMKIEVKVDPSIDKLMPAHWGCKLTATTTKGKTITVHVPDPKGDPDNTLTWDDVIRKFNLMVNKKITPKTAEKVVAFCKDLEKQKDMGQLFKIINSDLKIK